jgi:ureidoacrylate peracid hydrolase
MSRLIAKPEPIEVNLAHSAIIVVDMQNAFVSKGGTLDIAGIDLGDAPRVARTIRAVLDAGRAAGVPVIYLQMAYKADMSDTGSPRSPNCRKEAALHLMDEKPEWRGKLLIEGSWDSALVDELAAKPGDLVITKTRYSGFVGTTLDSQLRVRGIQFLFFTGIAANVCVESTLRHAFFLDYWPILVSDCTMAAGGPDVLAATIFNVESFFGWTVTSNELRAHLAAREA